jgi:23S rRNA (cytosine1962-C5)-methyltransferase
MLMNTVTRVFLKPQEEKELQQGFPWVYDNEIATVKFDAGDGSGIKQTGYSDCCVADGSGVEVYTKAGGFIGTGVLNRQSKIAIRMIGQEHADQIYADTKSFWSKKVRDAINIRKLQYPESDSYRLIFGEADFIPGFIVDRFITMNGQVYLVVQFLSLSCEIFRNELLEALNDNCNPYGIYERSDAKVRNKEGLALKKGWIGKQRDSVITITENGITLNVDLANGQKTGYFLDQKNNRAKLKVFCHGKKVLDTFSHTGAFGLNAVNGGAREVIAVDISPEAVAMITKNITANNAGQVMTAKCADVFDILKQYEESGEKFGVIILDPPAFAKNLKAMKKAYGGYKEINLRAMRLLAEGGILVTCSCSYFFDENMFYSMLMHAAKDSHKRVQVLLKSGAGPDHPVLLGYPKSEYLKCAFCRVL